MKFFYYVRRFAYNALPGIYFEWKFKKLKRIEALCDKSLMTMRLDYYFKVKDHFKIPSKAVRVRDFKRNKRTNYFLDLKDFLHFFSPEMKFAYHFGDETHVNSYPTLFKARPIGDSNINSILFKLNKDRHFRWVTDSLTFEEKFNRAVWRGTAYHKLRKDFVVNFWDHPLCNVGQTNGRKEDVPWQKPTMSIKEQLQYKFIFCLEGNDVATNLKWVMSSNSLCFMPRPRFETWFMEGTLQAGIHYVELKDDFSDLEEKIEYYSEHSGEAKQMITNSHKHVERFRNQNMEELLSIKVLERYAELSGQSNAVKYKS